jgi:5-deoxy-D-glucuronate isomerase
MSYQWSNTCKLDTLKVSGDNNQLIFQTGSETATVYLEKGDIKKVICKLGNDEVVHSMEGRHHIVVGEGSTQRDVYHYLTPSNTNGEIRLGITKHCHENSWSSLPHPFELNTEPGFEEVFFYILKGGSERAIQRGEGVWYNNEKVNDCWLIENQTFGTIPMGYHPVVGEPGVKVAYIWAYLCKKQEWEKI